MKFEFLIPFLLLSYFSFSQEFRISIPAEMNKAKDLNGQNISITGNYIISVNRQSSGFYKFTLEDDNENSETFDIKPITYPLFESKFSSAFSRLVKISEDKDINPSSIITEKRTLPFTKIFAEIISYYNTTNERPVVAVINLKKKIKVYNWKNCEKKEDIEFSQNYLEKVKIEMSFYQGYIEKIEISGDFDENNVRFTNKYSIGISSKLNIEQLNYNRLYSFTKFKKVILNEASGNGTRTISTPASSHFITKNILMKEYDSVTNKTIDVYKAIRIPVKYKQPIQYSKYSKENNGCKLFIYLGDAINYDREIDINANDISPEPQKLILDENQVSSKLYKEKSTKLFEAIVYSDLLGIFDEENPNGIIQTEVSKRFNLNTKRRDVPNSWFWQLIFPPLSISEGLGYLGYFDTKISLSKIEENNKFLLPENITSIDSNNMEVLENYFSPISIFQHRSFSIGGDLNLINLENQNSKLNMYFNTGFSYGRSGLKINNNTEGKFINSFELPLEVKLHFIPERRYGLEISNKFSFFNILSSDIENLSSIENKILVDKKSWLNTTEITSYLNTSSTGKLFIRYRFIHELENIKNNFSQFQFGYSFYILERNRVNNK
ncbi:MAG: hypothetical protein ACPGTO_08430 [Polaribacter sp.]